MLSKSDWSHLIPHAGTMCLLDAVLEYDARRIHATTATHAGADNPLIWRLCDTATRPHTIW